MAYQPSLPQPAPSVSQALTPDSREETAHLIAERGDLEWLSPIRIYERQA